MNGQFNNLTLSNDLLITGNIQSSGNIDTDNINCEAITSKSLTCDNININNNMTLNKLSTSRLDLISAIPIDFFNGGINYNLTSSHLKSLYDLGGGDVASKAYVDKQINDLISAAPDMLNTFSEIASRIQTDETIRDSILVQLSKKATLDSDNVYTGGLNTFNNNVKILGSLNGHDLDSELSLLESDIVNLNTSITALNTQLLNKANTTNPQFNNYVYVNNNANGSMLPSVNNGFLAIGANVSGSGETNFINTGGNQNSTLPAFNFSKMINSNTKIDLFTVNNNGDCTAKGNVVTSDVVVNGNSLLNTLANQSTQINNNFHEFKVPGSININDNMVLSTGLNSGLIVQMIDPGNVLVSPYTVTLPIDMIVRPGMEIIFITYKGQALNILEASTATTYICSGVLILKSVNQRIEIIYDSEFNNGLNVNGDVSLNNVSVKGTFNSDDVTLNGTSLNTILVNQTNRDNNLQSQINAHTDINNAYGFNKTDKLIACNSLILNQQPTVKSSIAMANNGSGLVWGGGNSQIYDNNYLNIETDDYMNIKAPTLLNIYSKGSILSHPSLNVNLSTNVNVGNFGTIEVYNNGNTSKLPLCLNGWGGKVGVGTNNPLFDLDVSGNMNVSGTAHLLEINNNTNNWYINQSGNATFNNQTVQTLTSTNLKVDSQLTALTINNTSNDWWINGLGNTKFKNVTATNLNATNLNVNDITTTNITADVIISPNVITTTKGFLIGPTNNYSIDGSGNAILNNIVCNSGNLKLNTCVFRNPTAGYFLDGSDKYYDYRPVLCSTAYLKPYQSDDMWVVNPGFKFVIYSGMNYISSTTFTIDNTGGTIPITTQSQNVNNAGSVKVYFLGEEVRLNFIS